ncbi:hypothetical protein HPB51_029416 [Rhipicephalus microplus]|uniref:Uncharacterized protein n=1 Tax=Rhipicephalus microplus TaxID=6941 RepID=A0A9J6CUL6_RHIMP|nr:hypothetical protein HPB51_029416 [Rhipicephalus microplus]
MSRTCASPAGELREFANVLNAADADSIYLYLPRNLSSCHMCAEVEEQHWEHKMKLLAGFLRRESSDSGDDDLLSMKPIPAGGTFPVFTTKLRSGRTVQSPAMATNDNSSASPSVAPATTYLTMPYPRDPAASGAPRGILRRSKPSPGWPERRRRGRLVTFADALGLELEHVRRLVHRIRTPAAASEATPQPRAASATLEAAFSVASGDELRQRVLQDKVRAAQSYPRDVNRFGREDCTQSDPAEGTTPMLVPTLHTTTIANNNYGQI